MYGYGTALRCASLSFSDAELFKRERRKDELAELEQTIERVQQQQVSIKVVEQIEVKSLPLTSKEELSANMYCIREINLIGMRFLCLPDDYGLCNQFAEVVHGELGKNLLENELHFFACK